MSDEPSGAQKLIAQTMGAHRSYYNHGDDCDRCTGCKWRGHAPAEHEAHVAVEVDKALGGLKREIRGCRGVTTHVRFASGWTVTE